MDGLRNKDLVELWDDMLAALPPQMAMTPTSLPYEFGLYRRICASTVHPSAVS
jgi:hypothetical protein